MASTTNPFDLLGNDVEDPNVIQPSNPPREIVKKSTSSKKQDVPPPSADPSRAKHKPKLTGNEAAIRDKSREKNKKRDAPTDTKPKHPKSKNGDRHSRTARTDSHKKSVQGWGESSRREADAEEQGERDAQAEEAEDAEESKQNSVPKMSLQDWYSASNTDLNKKPEAKKAAPIEDAQLIVKEEEVLVEATKFKNVRAKQLKSKEFLEFDATFIDSSKPSREGGRGGRGGRGGQSRGQGRGGQNRGGQGRGSRGGLKKVKDSNPVEKNADIDPKNLPTLS